MILKLVIYILLRNWKIRVSFAMATPKIIFRFNFFVALCASDIVPSKVFFNCCKVCEDSFLQYKRKKEMHLVLSLLRTKYIFGLTLLGKNVDYLII